MNGTPSVPKSVPRLVLDKVRLVFVSENNLQSPCSIKKVPNKSLSQELNNVFITPFLDLMPLLPPSFVGRASRALNPRKKQ